jgi:hypothetical protein
MTKMAGLSSSHFRATAPVASSKPPGPTASGLQPSFTRSGSSQIDGMKRASSEVADPAGPNKRRRAYDPQTTPARNPYYDPSLDQYLGLSSASPSASASDPRTTPARNPYYDPSLDRFLGGSRAPGQ